MKMILKSFLFAVVLLFVQHAAYSQEKTDVSIKCKVINRTNIEKISLVRYSDNLLIAESSGVEKDEFIIHATVEKVNLYKLVMLANDYLTLIIAPGEKITVEIDEKKLHENIKVNGSVNSELLLSTSKMMVNWKNRQDSLDNVFRENQTNSRIDSLKPLLVTAFNNVAEERENYLVKMISEHPASLAVLFFINELDINKHQEVYKLADQALYKAYPDNIYVQDFHKTIAHKLNLSIGSQAPDINLPSPDGNIISLSSLKGKVVLVDFWASWCGPCRKENPNVVRIYNKYKHAGFEIYGVSLDRSRESWLKAIETDKLTWIHVSDLKYWQSEGARTYGVNAIPFTVLLDKDGKIIAKGLRGTSLESKLEEIFNL